MSAVESKFDQRLRIGVSIFPRPNPERTERRWSRRVLEADAARSPNLAPCERETPPHIPVRDVVGRDVPTLPYIEDMDGAPVITVVVGGGQISFKIVLFDPSCAFNRHLPWYEISGGKARLHRQYRHIKGAFAAGVPACESPVYEVQLLVVVNPPSKKPSPIYWDWNRRFFPLEVFPASTRGDVELSG
jgi:hypothetical protein